MYLDNNIIIIIVLMRITKLFRKCNEKIIKLFLKREIFSNLETVETALQRCSSCKATLLKLHLGMGVILSIIRIFSDNFFVKILLKGCFWIIYLKEC